MNKIYKPHTSSVGNIAANLVSALALALLFIAGDLGMVAAAVLFIVEKKSGLVRFYIAQGFLIVAARAILNSVISAVTGTFSLSFFGTGIIRGLLSFTGGVLGLVLKLAVFLAVLVIMALCISKAYKWQEWKLPLLGDWAEKFCNMFQKPAYNGEGDVPAEAILPGTDTTGNGPENKQQ